MKIEPERPYLIQYKEIIGRNYLEQMELMNEFAKSIYPRKIVSLIAEEISSILPEIGMIVGYESHINTQDLQDKENMKDIELRDYFAGMALQPLMAERFDNVLTKDLVKRCYDISDEMLEERKVE